jgi:hypothetical protein
MSTSLQEIMAPCGFPSLKLNFYEKGMQRQVMTRPLPLHFASFHEHSNVIC